MKNNTNPLLENDIISMLLNENTELENKILQKFRKMQLT